MGFISTLTRLNPERVLRIVVLIEMLFWGISVAGAFVSHYKNLHDQSVLHGIEARLGSRSKATLAEREYEKLKEAWRHAFEWMALSGMGLFLCQLFLWFGVKKKNRCLIFSWILCYILFGIIRIVATFVLLVPAFSKYLVLLWFIRMFYLYLALKYMLQITNEKRGQEQVEPPHFRPQTDDPREFREGLNYPVFPRSLEFADKIVAVNKEEHANPKRWLPTYDAIDSDGRMVVVVDDPFYEPL